MYTSDKTSAVTTTSYTTDAELCTSIWPFLTAQPRNRDQSTELASFARTQIAQLQSTLRNTPAGNTNILTPDDVLKENLHWFNHEYKDGFGQAFGRDMQCPLTAQQVSSVLLKTASLFLAFDITREFDASRSSVVAVRWPAGNSLRQAVAAAFATKTDPTKDLDPSSTSAPSIKGLTMVALTKQHGYAIHWTDNLKEHLTIKGKTFWIYKHKLLLAAFLQRPANARTDVIPRAILEEALDTLNLLFPPGHKKTSRLLKEHSQPFHSRGRCGRPPPPPPPSSSPDDNSPYSHWGAQLSQLRLALDQPHALGLRSIFLRRDRRNLVESVNFWLALLVAVLTVASIVPGRAGRGVRQARVRRGLGKGMAAWCEELS